MDMPLFASSPGPWLAESQGKSINENRGETLATPTQSSHTHRGDNGIGHNSNNNNNQTDCVDGYGGINADVKSASYDTNRYHHHPQQQQRNFFHSVFSALGESHEHDHDHGPSSLLLAPPPQFPPELGMRRGSSSSVESMSHRDGHRRRSFQRTGSCSRASDILDEEGGEPATLMTYMRGAGQAYTRMRKALRRLLQVMFVTRPRHPKLVCEAEVMEQVSWVCRDYIVAKLVARDMMSRKTGITPSNWPQSRHVIAAGSALETLHPRVYSNICRKLCLTMSSPKVVRNTLALFLEVLFEKSISWAKVVSMMAVASLYAEECASQGHPDYVHEVVGVILDFTEGHLLPWLVQQGGWEGFPLPEGDERNHLSKFRVFLVAGGATSLALIRYYFQVL